MTTLTFIFSSNVFPSPLSAASELFPDLFPGSLAPNPFYCTRIPFFSGQYLTSALFLSGIVSPPSLCNGLGACGKCLLRILSPPPEPDTKERELLSEPQLAEAWRLGCRHLAGSDVCITLLPYTSLPSLPEQLPYIPLATLQKKNFFGSPLTRTRKISPRKGRCVSGAIDLGTTSIHAVIDSLLFPLPSGEARHGLAANVPEIPSQPVATASIANPQAGAGPDVISRLAFCQSSPQQQLLTRITQATLSHLFSTMADPESLSEICLAANPAMTCIAFGKPLHGLGESPYDLPYQGGRYEHIPGLPPIWTAPLLSPFVGGDAAAGYLAALASSGSSDFFPFLLADMGTNGEFILALSPDEALVCSVALGPAIEGVGLHCGTTAAKNAITSFQVTQSGLNALIWNGKQYRPVVPEKHTFQPAGISGTGYISLLHALKKLGALTQEGRLIAQHALVKHAKNILANNSPELSAASLPPLAATKLALPHGFYLTGQDIEEFLKVKAAFSLAFASLLQQAKIPSRSLKKVFLTGALGTHVSLEDLEGLGFLPPGIARRVTVMENAALTGARILAQNDAAKQDLIRFSRKADCLDLTTLPDLMEKFAVHMQFSYLDGSLL